MIRPSTPEDNFWVGQMLLTVPAKEKRYLTLFSIPNDLKQLYLDVENGKCGIVMDDKGIPIGFVTYRTERDTVIITQLFIIPNMRKRYGMHAMFSLLDFIRSAGKHTVCYVHTENESMLKLVRYVHFTNTDTFTHTNGELYHRYVKL